jgi:hypothetical protein
MRTLLKKLGFLAAIVCIIYVPTLVSAQVSPTHQAISKDSSDGGYGGNMVRECGLKDPAIHDKYSYCAIDKRGSVRFVLLGDSKAGALKDGLLKVSDNNVRWLAVLPHGPITNGLLEEISNIRDIDTVVLVTAIRSNFEIASHINVNNNPIYNPKYLENLAVSKSFDHALRDWNRLVSRFLEKGKKIIIVIDNPALPDPKDCLRRKTAIETINRFLKSTNCVVPLETFNTQIKIYRAVLERIQTDNPTLVRIFDPTDIYCDFNTGMCEAIKNGQPMYGYSDHISYYAAKLVGRKLNEFIIKN